MQCNAMQCNAVPYKYGVGGGGGGGGESGLEIKTAWPLADKDYTIYSTNQQCQLCICTV